MSTAAGAGGDQLLGGDPVDVADGRSSAMSPADQVPDEQLGACARAARARDTRRIRRGSGGRPGTPNARARSGLGRVAAMPARVTPARRTTPQARRAERPHGGTQQLARVAARGAVVAVGTQHAHELADDLALGELGDRRERGSAAVSLTIEKWRDRQRGYLRQVGDAEHLPVASASSRRRAPTARAVWPPIPASTSSNTSVAPGAEAPAALMIASITRESSPPEAISRSGAGGHAGVGCDQELDAVRALGSGLGLRQLDLETRVGHRQRSELPAPRHGRQLLRRRRRARRSARHAASEILPGAARAPARPVRARTSASASSRCLARASSA